MIKIQIDTKEGLEGEILYRATLTLTDGGYESNWNSDRDSAVIDGYDLLVSYLTEGDNPLFPILDAIDLAASQMADLLDGKQFSYVASLVGRRIILYIQEGVFTPEGLEIYGEQSVLSDGSGSSENICRVVKRLLSFNGKSLRVFVIHKRTVFRQWQPIGEEYRLE